MRLTCVWIGGGIGIGIGMDLTCMDVANLDGWMDGVWSDGSDYIGKTLDLGVWARLGCGYGDGSGSGREENRTK